MRVLLLAGSSSHTNSTFLLQSSWGNTQTSIHLGSEHKASTWQGAEEKADHS